MRSITDNPESAVKARPLGMTLRAGVVTALGAGLLGLTGCSYFAPQQTTQVYAASDGVQADLGDIQLRNMLIVSRGAGQEGRIIGGIFNTSSQEVTVTFSGNQGARALVVVPARGQVLLNQRSERVILRTVAQAPGSLESVTVHTSAGLESTEAIPVLDGTLAEYQPYLPGGTEPSRPSKN